MGGPAGAIISRSGVSAVNIDQLDRMIQDEQVRQDQRGKADCPSWCSRSWSVWRSWAFPGESPAGGQEHWALPDIRRR